MAAGGPYRNCTMLQMLENDTVNCLQVSSSAETYKVINAVLYAIVMMIGLSGNTLVIYVILRYSKMQTVTNFYIFNLALADEIFLISITFILTTMALGRWPFGLVVCKIYWTITSINQFTSSLFLTVMSADRYLAVCHPISSTRWRTPLVSKIVCLTAWTASSLMVVPLFMYAAEYEGRCNIYWPDSIGGEKAFTLYTFVLSFAIPVVLILIFYIFVINKLRHVGPKNRSRERKKSHRKVTRLVLTVITVYFFCYLPFWVTQLTMMLSQESRVHHSPVMVCVILLVYILTYFNSALNPILYAFLSDNFKKSFVKACQCARLPDVNNALQAENSVFPRRSGAKLVEQREMEERGLSADPSTGLTGLVTSRSYNRVCLAETTNGHTTTLKVPSVG